MRATNLLAKPAAPVAKPRPVVAERTRPPIPSGLPAYRRAARVAWRVRKEHPVQWAVTIEHHRRAVRAKVNALIPRFYKPRVWHRPTAISIEEVTVAVCEVYCVRRDDLLGTCKRMEVVSARECWCYVGHEIAGHSYPALAAARREPKAHSTMITAAKRAAARYGNRNDSRIDRVSVMIRKLIERKAK